MCKRAYAQGLFTCLINTGYTYEPRREKTCLRFIRPGPTQTGLYSHRRWLKVLEVEVLYYLLSESKGGDHLGYRAFDLRLCFRICTKTGFLVTRLIYTIIF